MSAAASIVLYVDVDFRPLRVEHWKRAISDFFSGKCEILEFSRDHTIQGVNQTYPMPSVVRVLRRFKRDRIRIKFSRLNIYARDGFVCFGAGTRVLMANGRQIPIETVTPGDRVIDAFGSPTSVVAISERIAENCVTVKHRGSFERTLTTADHPFRTSTGEFVPIGDVKIGDGIGYLTFPRSVHYELPLAHRMDICSMLPKDKWFRLRNGRIYRTRRPLESGLPATIVQTPDLAYLMGLYVAKGSATAQGLISFSFHLDEADSLATDVKRISESTFGVTVAIDRLPERNVSVARFGNKTLAQLLWEHCGKSARNKKVPWDLIGPYHAEFLRGLFLGDAHFDEKRKKVVLSMTGKPAVLGAQSMLWGLGIFPTLQGFTPIDKQPVMCLTFAGQSRAAFMDKAMGVPGETGDRTFGDDNFVYRRLQEVTAVEGDHVVYNLEVDGSHTYIANGLAVHNCQYDGKRYPTEDLTFDHVIPRSRGGKTEWGNISTCCSSCNAEKSDRTPAEAGMTLLRQPKKPHFLPSVMVKMDARQMPPEWAGYWSDTLEG